MNLKKELKATQIENESLRQMIIELSNGTALSQASAKTPQSMALKPGVRLPLITPVLSGSSPVAM